MKDKLIPLMITFGVVILAVQVNNRLIDPMIANMGTPANL